MNTPRLYALFLATALFAVAPVSAQHDHDDPVKHRPSETGVHEHRHAHPGVSLSHPIVIESPLPETKLRLDYTFADAGDDREHTVTAEAEYAFTREFSVELVLPYTFLDPDEGDSADRLNDAAVALKLATYGLVDRNLFPAVGVEVVLPTGDEERGIGSDHVVELEPFVRVGYWRSQFELIGALSIGIPLNQTDEERDEEDFVLAYGASFLYHVRDDVQALVELHGESVFGDEDASALYVSPGVTFQPFTEKSISLGLGVSLPLTDDRDFDYAVNVMSIFHF